MLRKCIMGVRGSGFISLAAAVAFWWKNETVQGVAPYDSMYETEKPTPTNPIYHQFFGSFQTFSDAEDGEDLRTDGKRTRVTHQTSTSGRRAIFQFGFTDCSGPSRRGGPHSLQYRCWTKGILGASNS